jgi:hypothetical protein
MTTLQIILLSTGILVAIDAVLIYLWIKNSTEEPGN